MDYCPHPGQLKFHLSNARFRAVAPGRRWGKTFCGAAETIKVANMCPNNSIGFVVTPSYGATSLGKCMRTILRFAPRELIKQVHRTPGNMYIRWLGDKLTYFRSAEVPDSCKGESVHYAWFDEPASMKAEIWEEAVLPSLMDTNGVAWFTGTPKGSNWYRFLFMKGQGEANSEYWSHGGSSYENTVERGGYLQKSSIDSIACQMTDHNRLQEIMGVFLDDMGVVFRNVMSHTGGCLEDYSPLKHYVVGADVAKHSDFTVTVVLDADGHVCYFDRYNNVDWTLQEKRIANISKRYGGARVLIDSTGVGDPVYDALRGMGVSVQSCRFTSNQVKVDVIENLTIMLENSLLTYPAELAELIKELKIFGYKKTLGGTTVYGAPEGYHDDCVVAFALAAWQQKRSAPIETDTLQVEW